MHNTLKLVEQIVYMLIVGGLQGSAVGFSEENQEFYGFIAGILYMWLP